MKIKVRELFIASTVFGKLVKVESLPINPRIKIGKMKGELQAALDIYNEKKDRMLKKLGTPAKNEKGEEITNQYTIMGDGIIVFNKTMLELENEEVDFPDKIDCPKGCDFSWYEVIDNKPVERFLSADDLALLNPVLDIKE